MDKKTTTKREKGDLMKRFLSTPVLLFVAIFAVIGSVILFQANAATGATYYVSPSGSDSGAGSSAAPWKTLQFAIGKLAAGDTLIVKGGAYSGTLTGSPSGTASSPITMKAASGERPVLTGLVRLTNANYFTWDGVNVTFPSSAGSGDHMFKMTGGTGWRVTNSEIWGAKSYAGMLIAGAPSKWQIDHNYIHDTYKSNDTNQDHLIYANSGNGGGVITRNIFATSPNGRGVKIGPPSGGSSPIGNITISYNTFYNNTGPSNIQLSYGASGNKIFRNIMVKSGAENITPYNLNGTGNEAYDNVGWDSSAVMGKSSGLADKGGNLHEDPQLNLSTFKPGNSKFAAYGRYAPGDTGGGGVTPTPTPDPDPTPTPNPSDTQAPTKPGGLSAFVASPTSVNLSWDASSDNVGVTGYNVYRNGNVITKVGKVTEFTSGGLSPNTTYSYQVEALDAAGNKSAKSDAVSVTTPGSSTTPGDTTAPSVNITSPSDNSTVSGTVNVAATASDNVAVTKVEFRVDGVLKATDTASPYSYSWNTTGLVGQHTVDARAVDAAGNAKVDSVTVTTNSAAPAPDTSGVSKPTGLTAQAVSSSQINLYWNVASTYRIDIYRDGVKVGSTSSDSKYGDTYKLQSGKSYKYYIVARDEAGKVSAPSNTVTASTSGSGTVGGGGTTTPSTSKVGSLTGLVKNSSGAAIKGAKVSFNTNGKTYTAVTNSSGTYMLSNVPAVSAPIVYSATGYATKNDNVTVLADTVKTKNVTLSK